MELLSSLREAGGYAEEVAAECAQNRVTAIRAQRCDDAEKLCSEMYEMVSAGRETLMAVGGQRARGWTSFPRIPMFRDLADIAIENHGRLEDGMAEGRSTEEAGTSRRRAGVEPMMERLPLKSELSQEPEDRYQDRLLFVGE